MRLAAAGPDAGSVPALVSHLPDWPRAHGPAPMRARSRSSRADFQVSEELGFEPDGEGEHDFLWVEKEGQNTAWVAGLLARYAGVPERDVGFAGLKDRQAVTRQWFSVRRAGGSTHDWKQFAEPGIRILDITRNRRKLRRGAHRGNRFRLALRDGGALTAEARQRLETLREQGVPNYFGEQRFGHDVRNLALANELFAGRRLSRARKSLALSAARSWLFNRILERRVNAGTWNRLLPGDVANLDGSGSQFAVAEIDAELARRVACLDLHPTGALWGCGEPEVSGDVRALESGAAREDPELARGLEEQRVEQSRRPLRARVRDLEWEVTDDNSLWLAFSLHRGAFATSVLRELADPR